jgi:hypothetical protein
MIVSLQVSIFAPYVLVLALAMLGSTYKDARLKSLANTARRHRQRRSLSKVVLPAL